MNVNKFVIKAYEKKPLKEIVKAPVWALQGISENDGELLKKAFNIKTVSDLAKLKYVRWARAICTLADSEE